MLRTRSLQKQHAERIIYLSHKYPFEILHVVRYPVPKEHVHKPRIGMNSHVMGDPTPTNELISFLIQIQTMSQRTLLRQFMRYNWTDGKRHNAISCNNLLRTLLPGSQTQWWWCQYHMSISSHELNACWKQLNIKHLSQQVLVAPNISSFTLCRSATTQIRSIWV